MTQAQADALASSHKSLFCDITGIFPTDIGGWWFDPSTDSLHIVVATRGYVSGVAVTTFIERIQATDWCVGPSSIGVHFLFRCGAA